MGWVTGKASRRHPEHPKSLQDTHLHLARSIQFVTRPFGTGRLQFFSIMLGPASSLPNSQHF